MYFYKYVGMVVGMWSTIQYDTLCRNCFDFLLWVKNCYYYDKITFVGYNSCFCGVSVLLKITMKILVNFSISVQ